MTTPDEIRFERSGHSARLTLDDGGRNVLTPHLVSWLRGLVRDCADSPEIATLTLRGNARALSVGLDTNAVLRGDDDARRMLADMRETLATLYLSRLRSVVVVSGHATAAGAMLLLAADVRIGVRGEGRIGLSEVRFGLEVPPLTRQLVRDRLAGPAQYPATALARLHAPEDALKAGFLDRLAETPEAAETLAQEAEAELAALDEPAYLATKLGMRTAFAELMQREGG